MHVISNIVVIKLLLYLHAVSVVKCGHFEEVLWVKIAATLANKLCSDVTLSTAEQGRN